jgi:hypothetical protein
VAAAHYMAFEEGDRDHYAAQSQKYSWVQAAVRYDQPEVVQGDQGNSQDPSTSLNVETATEAVPSDSTSLAPIPSSSLDGHSNETDLEQVENETHVAPEIEDENNASDQQDVTDAASNAVDDSQEHIEDVCQQIDETSRPATPELDDNTLISRKLSSVRRGITILPSHKRRPQRPR